MLADFTLETLPVERSHVLILGIWRLLLLLGQHPVLEALEVNETNGTLALASNDQGVLCVFLGTPANSALNVFFILINVLNTFNLHSFSDFLIVQFFLGHFYLVASEIFDSESHSSKLDSVKLLDFVVVFTSFIFK